MPFLGCIPPMDLVCSVCVGQPVQGRPAGNTLASHANSGPSPHIHTQSPLATWSQLREEASAGTTPARNSRGTKRPRVPTEDSDAQHATSQCGHPPSGP